MIRAAIEKTTNKAVLTYDEAYDVMNEIMSGETLMSAPDKKAEFSELRGAV